MKKQNQNQIKEKPINVLSDNRPVALGARLEKYPQINTLGFNPNFEDYTIDERRQILNAHKIYYPTAFYADFFNVMGKETFPSYHTYKFAMDKIRQTAVFKLLSIPHPRTRVFYGKKQKKKIMDYFNYPFIAKKPVGSSKGNHVFLIQNVHELTGYLTTGGPAYIQEYFPIEQDMRIIIIGKKVRLAYFRKAGPDQFKTNISQGGTIDLSPLPPKALELALMTALKCGWDDTGIDIIEHRNRFYVVEANMKYGTKGFKKAGINYKKMLGDLIATGQV